MKTQARQKGDRLIGSLARREVQSFFDDLTSGNPRYRTVASLRGQITQEYRGRCILELLQNAHDALAGAGPTDLRQISFVLTTGPKPELLVANSGRPFRRRDFEGICQLGQSPKDPNESVGNKGLGFQSVLEVSTRPQIWSTAADEGSPAFAFEFDQAGTRQLVEQALSEIDNDSGPPGGPVDPDGPIIDWASRKHSAYRQRLAETSLDPLGEARDYLSPYSIPLQVGDIPEEVDELLGDGHVTVVRLRLDGGRTGTVDEAIESITTQLEQLDAKSTVFLAHVEKLTVAVDGNRRVFERAAESTAGLPGASPTREELVLVDPSSGGTPGNAGRTFRVWTRSLGGSGDPVEERRIQQAVRHLPNRWPEVRQVDVAVAVEDTASPEPGTLVIFLPTEELTETGAHVNAPFYGSLDRRHINFDDDYNALLLEYVIDLTLDVAIELAAGPPEAWRGRAVIDLLASTGSAEAGGQPTTRERAVEAPADGQPILMDQIFQRAEETNRDLEKADLILCDDGWRDGGSARIMPEVAENDLIGGDRWRESSDFAVVSSELDGRRPAVETLLERLGGSPSPAPPEWAHTVEHLAARIGGHDVEATWDDFLTSVNALLPRPLRSSPRGPASDPLGDAKFLPTADGRLLSASDTARVFFQPRRGFDDAADFVDAVPDSLQDRIAFLHEDVTTHEGPQSQRTDVREFLGRNGRFVQTFRREDLLRETVIPALPELPSSHDTEDAARCAEMLGWTLELIRNHEQEMPVDLLKRLPVACHGGWFAAGEAIFGPGWPGRHGAPVQALADGLPPSIRSLLEYALLPPRSPRWGLDADAWGDLFERAGVVDALPTRAAEPFRFRMSASYSNLPREAPAGIPQSAWSDWLNACRHEIRPDIQRAAGYQLDQVHLAPELHSLEDLEDPAARALSELILAFLEDRDAGWETARLTRSRYPGSPLPPVTSPLKYWLTNLPWLHDNELEPRPLFQRWFVPESLLRGQGGRFAHLAPLSLKLARRLGENAELRATLKRLGLNVYPTEDERTGPELLEALADAWGEGSMPAGGFDVFLGQVRHAWRHLAPDRGLPKRFLIRTRPRSFEITTDPADAYLPDDEMRTRSLRDHQKPILEMRPDDARKLADALLDVASVRRASTLSQRCVADGVSATDAAEHALALDRSQLRWLPVVLLTLAAHGGTNPRGPATKAWQDAAARLRGARAHACGSLSVELTDADEVVARSEPAAHWLPDESAFLFRPDSPYDDLAPASQAILERQDLLKDLRFVLATLEEGAPEPTQERIEAALDRAEIDAEAFADIRHRWHGNTAHMVDRIRPVLKLLAVPANGLEAAAADSEALTKWLSSRLAKRQATGWPAEKLISAAKASHDDRAMGQEAWRNLGDVAQLPAWNDALAELGDRYAECENVDADEQAKRHIEEAAPLLRSLARHAATEVDDADLFLGMEEASRGLETPTDWANRWWEVPFDAVLRQLRTAYLDELAIDSGLVDALDDPSTIAGLREALVQRGIVLDVDPYDTFRQNENRLSKEIAQVRDLHRAWLAISGANPVHSGRKPPERPKLPSSAYLRDWSEAEIFEQALETVDDTEFNRQCDGCRAIDEARAKLKVTPEAVEQAQRRRRGRQQEEQRKQRTEEIAGKPFEVDGHESYRDLLARLDSLPDLKGPSLKSDESTLLVPPSPGRAPSQEPTPGSPGKTSHRYSRPHLPVLVGIVGEMHAYRYLRSQFGNEVVTPGAWMSENGEKVLPPARGEKRDASDSHGYDFRFVSDGITEHFEVKATTGDDTSFSLPPSEIRAATNLANGSRSRWRILRIRHAFSDTPQIDLLPNPFEEESSDLFRISSSGGLTVRYALDTAT